MKRSFKHADFCIAPEDPIHEAIARIDKNTRGIVLAVDDQQHLLGTVTDGDIRRAMLDGTNLHAPVNVLLSRKATSRYSEPLSATVGTTDHELMRIMHKAQIRHLPIIDNDGKVVDLVTLDQLMPDEVLPVQAIIMAGGYGKRLHPLTEDTPKPMLPVGDQPLMEHIVGQLRDAGIQHVNVSTHFMPEKIIEHFGDGEAFGVDIEYVSEDRPLGTAGALSLIDKPDHPLLVINGDILTGVDFKAMLAFHSDHHADVTVGVRQYDLRIPYGVIESEGAQITRIREKPMFEFFVNAGIYLLDPRICSLIPNGEPYDMTDLIDRLIVEGHCVVCFPIIEYWLDIGQYADYEQARQDIENGRFKI